MKFPNVKEIRDENSKVREFVPLWARVIPGITAHLNGSFVRRVISNSNAINNEVSKLTH